MEKPGTTTGTRLFCKGRCSHPPPCKQGDSDFRNLKFAECITYARVGGVHEGVVVLHGHSVIAGALHKHIAGKVAVKKPDGVQALYAGGRRLLNRCGILG